MKRRILSVTLALCLCISSQSIAYAEQENLSPQENVSAEESASGLSARDSTIPTQTEAYNAMIALKDQDAYKEGTPWTNDEPYSGSGYHWNGGTLDGANISAVGCVAFAFILSDAAFGNLKNRMYAAGGFTYEDIKVGDILRMNNDVHTVIVLEVSDAGVVVAEGNISTGDHQGKVHWGRAISKEVVMRDTSHYITRYPEGYIPPDDPEANVSIANGTLEGGLAWNLTKAGTMTISGNGAMPEFSSVGEQPWSDNSDKIRKVIIEDGVTSIGSCAFWNCGVLGVEISSSVATIGNSAFRSSSIISATIPSGVKTIGDSAFCECQNLSSVTVSEGVETIGQCAFQSCTKLTSIALPASIEEVGAAAFFQCQEMISATFAPGSKQVKMGDNMFTQCYKLMSVTLPKSIDRIGEGMFQNCGMLAGVEIPQGAESIGGSAFASCSGFTVVLIPDSVTTIGIAAFSKCPLTDIYFTGTEAQWNNISKIGDTASAVSKATMHYNYTPSPTSDPDDGDTTPTVTVTPTVTTTPTVTDEPTATTTPTVTTTPAVTGEPTATNTPTVTDTPVITNTPIITNIPGVINTPIATNTPGVTDIPEVSGTPDETGVPDETGTPDATDTPSAPDDSENPSDTTVTENPDGSKTETTTSTVKTEDGTTIQTTEVVNKDSNGKVTGSSTESIISTDSENGGVSVVVNVKKNARGKITEATANIPDTSSFSGQRALIQGSAVKQITEAAGTNSVTVSVEKKNGSNPYTAIVNTADLTAGNKLNVVIKKSNGDYILANAKKYTVDKNGDIFASMKGNQTYEFVNSSKMNNLSKKILQTVKVKNSSKTVKKSKTVKMALKKTLNMENVKSIQYSVSKKAVASVTKKGVVKGKKTGSAVIKAKVTLKNGRAKTVRMKVKVK